MENTHRILVGPHRNASSARSDLYGQRRYSTPVVACILFVLMGSMPVTAQVSTNPSFDAAAVNSSQVVVLTTGGVLKGKVSRRPGSVVVETESGSRPVLRQDRVDFICNSMPEAYWEKLARTKSSDTAGQISLFDFCLKHKLLDEAENQINLLNDPRYKLKAEAIAKLQRRLLASLEQESARMRLAQRETTANDSPVGGMLKPMAPSGLPSQPIASDIPKAKNASSPASLRPYAIRYGSLVPAIDDDGNVIEISNPTDSSQKSAGSQPNPPLVADSSESSAFRDSQVQAVSYSAPLVLQATDKEIYAELRKLPSGSVASFRRQVEPLLVSGCVTCHDKSSGNPFNGFPLIRVAGKDAPDRYSQRNLFAVLGLIERHGNPKSSYLWTLATQPHASLDKPVFPVETEEAANLLAWLSTFTLQEEGANPVLANTSETEAETIVGERKATEPVRPIQAVPDLATMPSAARPTTGGLSTIGEIPSLGGNGLRAKGYVQVDPFDPEIFNRQVAAKNAERESASSKKR